MSMQRGGFAVVVVCLWVAVVVAFASSGRADGPAQCQANDPTTVKVGGNSAVCGKAVANGKVYAYLGIPYAQPPLKALRWRAPQAAAWPPSPAVQRIAYGHECVQTLDFGHEDCLYLNVWAPKDAINGAKKLPVMVYIHGGAFVLGSGSSPIFEGSQLATAGSGAVVVTLNYRLGALGFLVANGHGSGPIDGNFGLLDQQLAMKWVQQNIDRFGGDGTGITLFGESAGAMSVGLHTLVVPSSKGLFAAAVMESNPLGVDYLRHDGQTGDPALKEGNAFLDDLCRAYNNNLGWPRCPDAADGDGSWLQHVTQLRIISVQNSFTPSGSSPFTPSLPWAPVVDGTLVTAEPYSGYATGMPRKPLGFGVNADEGVLFAALAYHSDPAFFQGDKGYNDALTSRFGAATATQILAIDRYNPGKQKDPTGDYYNATGVAFANLMTDYVFACGNLAVANVAAAAGAPPVYGYEFTQKPFFDLYYLSKDFQSDDGACEPSTNHVCHGNEMAYVFDNLDAVTRTDPPYSPTTGDKSLAGRMNAAWAAFAANPGAPGRGWLRYDRSDSRAVVQQWTSQASTPEPLGTLANCSKIWLKVKPYGG